MRFSTGLVIFVVFGWFLSLYGCSVFQKSQTVSPKQTDGISKIVSTIPEWSEDSSVLILGERHGNPESQKLTVALDSGQYDSLIVLVGNIHGIKSIAWAQEVSHNPQYFAGRLIQEGVKKLNSQD